MAAETSSLVEDEFAQTNFVYGCLQSIKEVNFRMQLEIIKHGDHVNVGLCFYPIFQFWREDLGWMALRGWADTGP
eukprot:233388-Pyramimonas_sp.AAC.1